MAGMIGEINMRVLETRPRRAGAANQALSSWRGLLLLLFYLFGMEPAWADQALRDPRHPELYQRVLTLPGARILRQPGSGTGESLPIFTPLYVYERQNDEDEAWLRVGERHTDGARGWVSANYLEDWHHQLVMQFAPRGRRQRVLFFEGRDALSNLVRDEGIAARLRQYYDYLADAAARPEELIAAEPPEAVDGRESAYLMPIFDFAEDRFARFQGGHSTHLLQVAGLNLAAKSADRPAPRPEARELENFRVGIVFLLDTTLSMDPYIERTYATVRRVYEELKRQDDLGRVSFGIVGYRDNIDHDPRLDYVTRVYQRLDPNASPERVLDNLSRVRATEHSTRDWREDTFAGLDAAVREMDWSPFHARFVVVVTDASARGPDDPLAKLNHEGLVRLQSEIKHQNITVFFLHQKTPQGERARDHDRAAVSFEVLGVTGDTNTGKYVPIPGGSLDAFEREIGAFARKLQQGVRLAAQGRLTEPGALEREEDAETRMDELVVNELFRAQLEYLGRQRGVQAPRFFRAWAAEHDLTDPRNQALGVRVLLNKNQLNNLAARVDEVLQALHRAEMDAVEGWGALVEIAGRYSTDPQRGDVVDIGNSGILPSFLQSLPYKSDVLKLSREHFISASSSEIRDRVRQLQNRQLYYRDVAQDDRNWIDVGAGPGEAVYPMPLDQLP